MPRPSTARRGGRSIWPGRNSRGRHPHGHAGDGAPVRRFTGMSRAIPGPLRAKGMNPLGTPGCRRRAVNGGGSLGFNSRSPRRVTPRRLSLRLRSMAPLGRHHCVSAHLSRCTPAAWASAARAMQDVYLCVRGDLQPPRTHRYLALRGRPPGLRDACCVPVPGDEKRGLGPSSRCAD